MKQQKQFSQHEEFDDVFVQVKNFAKNSFDFRCVRVSRSNKMDFPKSDGYDDEKYIIFKQDDLSSESFPVMKEIRRQGKLCDVTLKVMVSDDS